MAMETKTTSFQRLYPGLAGDCSVFSICHFWGGHALPWSSVWYRAAPFQEGLNKSWKWLNHCFPQGRDLVWLRSFSQSWALRNSPIKDMRIVSSLRPQVTSGGWSCPFPPPLPSVLPSTRAQKKLPQESLLPTLRLHSSGFRVMKTMALTGRIPSLNLKDEGLDETSEQLWGLSPPYASALCSKPSGSFLPLVTQMGDQKKKKIIEKCYQIPWFQGEGLEGKGLLKGKLWNVRSFSPLFFLTERPHVLAGDHRSRFHTCSNGDCQALKGAFVTPQMGPITHFRSKQLQLIDRFPRHLPLWEIKASPTPSK